MNKYSIEQFGKDHWSALAYAETCCVESKNGVGVLDRNRMRCNSARHPLIAGSGMSGGFGWKPEYSTRLKSYFEFMDQNKNATVGEKEAAKVFAVGHDDWDCLNDLESSGLVEIISLANGFVKMTEAGLRVAAELRAHKAGGGNFAGFVPGELSKGQVS